MNKPVEKTAFFLEIATSGRIVLASMFICCLLYTMIILGIGQAATPHTADGSLVRNKQGQIIGSEAMAQAFSRPEYIWPRPSAVDYNASAAGGSNLSPTNPKIRERAQKLIEGLGAADGKKVPADLVTASGSGMDPHITLGAAKYQARRVASARKVELSKVLALLEEHAERTGWILTPEPVVNVLRVNMALDRMEKQ
ncbi:MAG: potassium-transporting ATPase subunit KdpC [Desulfobacteraceae bacterium]|nr:MAG: potassium-transporting ATPase subunit KdpC [Desulfobacteraceae bacterium]